MAPNTGYDEAALRAVLAPIEAARGLPNAHYTDAATHAVEQEKVFFAGWSAIGYAHDVPGLADAKPIDFLGQPLLLLRDRDDRVRVFQNTCRHRGMILVSEPKTLRGVIRCPYHSWCYDLNGQLKTMPHVGGPGHNRHGALDEATLGLIEIRSHVWQDIVFVNVGGEAPSFEEANAPLLARWREFETASHYAPLDSSFDLEVATNWKLAVENYCESYHLPWIHPGLNSYSRLEDHYHIEEPGFAGQGTTVYDPQLSQEMALPNYGGLSVKWDKHAEYAALFPNVLLGVHRDHRFAIILMPLGVDRTLERVAIGYASQEALSASFKDLRLKNTAQWREVFEEDIFVVEGMQKGRHGRQFDGGRFSPVMDGPTFAFHRWVVERLLA
ncbi:Rieske 2Fe-2S domain-containing protein [Rhizobiaceae bacterium]|nr:Rieske 2Fe-2S domain-containing protein [Rhizobiaceae bacterium]